jgi:putative colanic acid biosynthesis acetyltransferase WcaF
MFKQLFNYQNMITDLTKSGSQFSTKIKIIRLLWNVLWNCVSILPRSGSSVRILLLRSFGAKIGKKCLIEYGVKVWIPWNLELADYVAIGRKVEIYNYDKIIIGSMTVISQYSYLCTGTHDYTHPYMPLIWFPITIGSECWIAAGTWVMPRVLIGNGVVVGANSTVTKDLPDWFICVGNPCKPLKKRIIDESKVK